MAVNTNKTKQLSLAEYAKIKDKVVKSKLKLTFPLIIKIALALPIAYCLFLIIYFFSQLRFVAEH